MTMLQPPLAQRAAKVKLDGEVLAATIMCMFVLVATHGKEQSWPLFKIRYNRR